MLLEKYKFHIIDGHLIQGKIKLTSLPYVLIVESRSKLNTSVSASRHAFDYFDTFYCRKLTLRNCNKETTPI